VKFLHETLCTVIALSVLVCCCSIFNEFYERPVLLKVAVSIVGS
jgi:hypothetical protein